jgi:hypothetical protein
VRARADGTFAVVADRLNQPTSLEFIGHAAYIVSLAGEVWKVPGVTARTDGWDKDDEGLAIAAGAACAVLEWVDEAASAVGRLIAHQMSIQPSRRNCC